MPLIIPPALAQAENVHRDELLRYFGTLAGDMPATPDGQHFLFVCFTHRCGSNFVCHALASGGMLNLGEEFYGAETVVAACRDGGLGGLGAYLDRLMAERAGHGWLVSKILVEQLAVFTETGWLERILPRCRFLLVERADVLAQAISLGIALQTESWTAEETARVPESAVRYERDTVTRLIDYVIAQRALTSQFFAVNGIVPFCVNYERFVRAPGDWAGEIGAFLGIDRFAIVPEAIRLQRQGGAVNAAWRARYLAGR